MTQGTLNYEPSERLSLCDKLEAYLKARPNQWVDGRHIATVAGSYGWRTRLSDLRKRGLTIENHQERYVGLDGQWRTQSLYRYVPDAGRAAVQSMEGQ